MKYTKTKPVYRDTVVIVVEFMHGDADLYTKEPFDVGNIEVTDKMLDMLDSLEGSRSVKDIADIHWPCFYETFCYRPDHTLTTRHDQEEDFVEGDPFWPGDKTNDGWNRAVVVGYKVFIYNADGEEFLCEP